MKTISLRKIRGNGFHNGDLKTKSLLENEESGHHKGDEDHIPSENQGKWFS